MYFSIDLEDLMRFLRYGENRKASVGDFFFNISALTFAGAVVANLFEWGGSPEHAAWGFLASIGFFCIGYLSRGGE